MKWVGGKGQLLEQFERFYPAGLKDGKVKKYAEPFLGGGASYFSICEKYQIKTAYLSDLNRDLILTYKVIQKKYDVLLDFLEQYQKYYDRTKTENRYALFLSVRKHFNEQRFEINYKKLSDNWMPRAAQFIFLNKTCFNGLFRLNSKGEFNVPFGKYKTANILTRRILRQFHALYKKLKLRKRHIETAGRKSTIIRLFILTLHTVQ
ncbi:MAG: hypothetical protein Pg6C_19780 [Treponemataceae bacterium]|nr:MAG: hypothetical protein Pg6C_19780 [Treponemataceae bacterium]